MTRVARRTAPAREAPLVAIGLMLALLVAACGAATVTPAPSGGAEPPSSEPGASVAPSSVAPSASADAGAVGPSPTPWPGGVVEAIVILGKADLEIKAAGADLGAAAAYEDLEAMWGAADGLATLVEKLQGQVDRIRDYPLTAPVAEAYDKALPDMLAGSQAIRDSIKAGDGAGLNAGFQQLAKGSAAYEDVRRLIGPLVEPALLMQRVLVK